MLISSIFEFYKHVVLLKTREIGRLVELKFAKKTIIKYF